MPGWIDSSDLAVFLDLRWPQSYLALGPTFELIDSLGISAALLPVTVPPLSAPTTPADDDDRGVRHRRFRAQAIAREIAVYAEAQGLVIREPYRGPDPALLNLAWLFVQTSHPDKLRAFLFDAFRAYWACELDPSDTDQVASLVSAAGGNAAAFRDWSANGGRSAAAELSSELAQRGIGGTPSYLVAEEYFQGRQHLPMIRWIVEGRQGRGPI